MKQFFFLVLPFMVMCTIVPKHAEATHALHAIATSDTSYRIIRSESKTYGYEILVNNKVMVRQKSIPGLPGNKGFVKKSDAVKTAKLVMQKLRQGIMPPTIATSELDSMKIQLPHR
jgi:hypothetical protein